MDKINAEFGGVCKLLFGQEIGHISEFEDYLSEMMYPYKIMDSCISGKKVFLSNP